MKRENKMKKLLLTALALVTGLFAAEAGAQPVVKVDQNALNKVANQAYLSDYADKLEAYTSAEPLPYTNILIKRARLLADVGESGLKKATRANLEALRAECQRMNAGTPLAAIERALAG